MGDAEAGAEPGKKLVVSFPLVKDCDMIDEMKVEVIELCTSACEKFTTNNESAAKFIKDTLDKKFGPPWQCVVGEGFGFVITHEEKSLLYMFFGGNIGVVVWKCS